MGLYEFEPHAGYAWLRCSHRVQASQPSQPSQVCCPEFFFLLLGSCVAASGSLWKFLLLLFYMCVVLNGTV